MGDSNIIEIKRIDTYNHNDIEVLSNLASSIVKQHYDSILGAEQNDYMIKMFQSVDAIKSQIENGYEYYMIFMGEFPVAFTAFYERTGKLYLWKYEPIKKNPNYRSHFKYWYIKIIRRHRRKR